MFDKEITCKKDLLEVMEALDKLNKNYVISKSKRKNLPYPQATFEVETDVWHIKEVSKTNITDDIKLNVNIDSKKIAEAVIQELNKKKLGSSVWLNAKKL